ncbi:mce-related protein, partial [Pasteurella multocida subsp. multocida str. Anand1_buffalo]
QPGDGENEDEFIAETEGPIAQVDDGDLLVHLLADDLGSISIGASVYFKSYRLGKCMIIALLKTVKKSQLTL